MHHGARLQRLIELSDYNVSQVIKKTNISNGSMYNMFKKPELLKSDIMPVLDLINVSYTDFLTKNLYGETENQRMLMLEQEVEYLKKQLVDKEEIIDLLKAKEKKVQKAYR